MKAIDYFYMAALVLLLFLSGCFSACDMSYSSVNQAKLAMDDDNRSKEALHYAQNYNNTIATLLFGNDFVNILASSLSSLLGLDIFMSLFPNDYKNMDVSLITSLIFLVFVLIFGEIGPKTIAKKHTYAISRIFVPFVKVCSVIFFPFVWPSNKLAELASRPFVRGASKEDSLATDEDLEAMVDSFEEDGIIDEDDSELLHRSIDFKETSCYEIMTPRVKVFGYDTDSSFDEFLKRDGCFNYSRIIVYKGDLDHIEGYIPVKSLLRGLVSGKKATYKDYLLPVNNVPRTMMISSAMSQMKESKHHIAIVRDEYGGTEGIITMEDILEELVGEVWDEKDKPTEYIRPQERYGYYYVDGRTNIDDFYNYFGLDPDKELEDDFSTVSGWVIDKLGQFAEVGSSFNEGNLEVTVTKVDEFTVKEIFVHKVIDEE